MNQILASLAAVILLSTAATARDDKDSLAKAAAKAAALESYAFKSETEFQSQFGGGNGPGTIPNFEGKYQKDVGTYIKSDKGEMFRKGDRVLVKQGQGDWQDLAQFQPPAQGGDNKQRQARGAMGARMMLRNLKAPHDELKDLEKGFKEVKKAEKTEKIGDVECTLYSGDLTEEAMKASPLGRMLGTFGQFGGGAGEVKGSAKVWVDADGNVAFYETVTKASVDFQGNTIEFSLTRRSEITQQGKAKVEVPEGVQKLLTEKPKTEEKKEEKQ